MKEYSYDTYLLSPWFQLITQWWDSTVFIDKADSSVILKLYDPLNYGQVERYYQIQSEISQKSWTIVDNEIEVQVLDPTHSDKFAIIENEDGILVVLPKVEWVNLSAYWSDIERIKIVNRVKDLLRNRWVSTSGGFEVKPENIMVHDSNWWKKLVLSITDIWARIDECLKQY